jgi:hypothetical protein
MGQIPKPSWYELRPAQNRKPATYRCPLCHQYLPALSAHMLLFPEGDRARRRHAHTECVMRARSAGRLPTRGEWQDSQPRQPGLLRRLMNRRKRRAEPPKRAGQ